MLKAYDVLNPIGSFTVAASFGNTHGVYAPGNVKLKPTILRDSQKYIQEQRKTGPAAGELRVPRRLRLVARGDHARRSPTAW